MEEVLETVCQVLGMDRSKVLSRQRDSLARPIAAKALCDDAGVTQREIAEVFNLSSGGAVSKQLARLRRMTKENKSVQRIQKNIERAIQR